MTADPSAVGSGCATRPASHDPQGDSGPEAARLREIAERVGKATQGPWSITGPYSRLPVDEDPNQPHAGQWVDDGYGVDGPEIYGDYESGFMTKDTAEFVAHAREDIPWLLALVERLLRGVAPAGGDLREGE